MNEYIDHLELFKQDDAAYCDLIDFCDGFKDPKNLRFLKVCELWEMWQVEDGQHMPCDIIYVPAEGWVWK